MVNFKKLEQKDVPENEKNLHLEFNKIRIRSNPDAMNL